MQRLDARVSLADGEQLEGLTRLSAPGKGHDVAFTRHESRRNATLGFEAELTGAIESLFTKKTYQQARDEARANNAAAPEAHRATVSASRRLARSSSFWEQSH